MERLVATRIVSAGRRGSSRPIVAETRGGLRLMKLRGAGQGTGPLVAEIIVAELAEALGLFVPPRSLVELPAEIETADWDDELADLLEASVGVNLGFDFLHGARDFTPADVERVPGPTRALIFWLDRFVMNLDRSAQNPNLLWWSDHLWLIDHGASLGFQYSWTDVTEASTREPRLSRHAHLFESSLSADEVAAADEAAGRLIDRAMIDGAVGQIDDSFLNPLTDDDAVVDRIRRRRAAFAAYLWKRVQPPRAFLELRPDIVNNPRRPPPSWLAR